VPLSEEVASRVPVELMERNDIGALWAWMTLATVRERVEKRRTSPDWEEDPEGDDDPAVMADVPEESGVVGEGTGEG